MNMKNNSEIRDRAWHLLWRRKWFLKTLGVTLLLVLSTQAVVGFFNILMSGFECYTINSYQEDLILGESAPELTSSLILHLAPSFLLYMFLGFIASGITGYGGAILANSAADDREHGWMGAAFAGFKMPLGLAWLSFLIWLVYLLWAVLASVPAWFIMSEAFQMIAHQTPSAGNLTVFTILFTFAAAVFITIMCIPFYRYRFLFRIKADHPDWSALECFSYCTKLTKNNKWRIFVLDCSFWRIMLLPLSSILLLAGCVLYSSMTISDLASTGGESVSESFVVTMVLMGLVMMVLLFVYVISHCLTAFYIGIGQSILYRRISAETE